MSFNVTRGMKNLIAKSNVGIAEPPWQTIGDSVLTGGQTDYLGELKSTLMSSANGDYANRIALNLTPGYRSLSYSIIAKAAISSTFILRTYNTITTNTVTRVSFDLSAGTFAVLNGNGSIKLIADGWYICETYFDNYVAVNDHQFSIYPPAGNGSLLIWRPVLCKGLVRDDYVETAEVPIT